MNSAMSSYLTAHFLATKGINVSKPLRDWLTRASYLARNRSGEAEQRRYVYWALRTIEAAAKDSGGADAVNWKQLSPVMPANSPQELPVMLGQPGGGEEPGGQQLGVTSDTSVVRAQVLEETLKRAPAELRPYVTQAFEVYDRDVTAGKRTYGQVSFIEMLNLAKNLLSINLKRMHSVPAPVAAVTSSRSTYHGAPQQVPEEAPVTSSASSHPPARLDRPTPLHASAVAAGELEQDVLQARAERWGPATAALSEEPRKHPRLESSGGMARAPHPNRAGPAPSTPSDSVFFQSLMVGCGADAAGREWSPDVSSPVDSHQSDTVFVGKSAEMERDYSRYEPTVEGIRPLPVLEQAFDHIHARCAERADRDGTALAVKYLNDQLKGMRQDLRVQNISDNFAVSVYEFHARLCLEIGDLGEFNQCQSALKQLYLHPGVEDREACCVSEFFCYRLAYLSLSQQYDALSTELINFTNEDLSATQTLAAGAAHSVRHTDVRCALSLCAACDQGDCFALARAVQHFPRQMMDLVRIYLQRLRVRWLLEILCGARGAVSLRFLMANLGFTPHERRGGGPKAPFWLDSDDATAAHEFQDFFATLKLALPDDFSFAGELARDHARNHSGGSLNLSDSVPSLDAARARAIVEQYVAYLGTRKDATVPTTP